MQQINQVVITGNVSKVYPLINTPSGVLVSRFILKHYSEQMENYQLRKVVCNLFCVLIGEELDKNVLSSEVEINGFLTTNQQKQMILHVNKIKMN